VGEVVAPIAHHENVSALMPERVAYKRRYKGWVSLAAAVATRNRRWSLAGEKEPG
jgi:hypothetical protein